MKKFLIGISGLCIALLGGCTTVGPSSSSHEGLAFPFDDRDWDVAHQAGNRTERITELVPKGERIDNWTRRLTIQIFNKQAPGYSEPLEATVSRIAKRLSDRYSAALQSGR
jgi:hypothetical protein